jgi:superfamily II helicase
MKENMQDLYDKFLEAQEAEFEYDVPDSFQIAGIKEEDLCDLCDSASTYLSVATAYNTVRVCKDCGHEEHTPYVR